MTKDEILQALRSKGLTTLVVAEALDCTPQHVGMVIARKRESTRIAHGIATALGKPVTEVFPDVDKYRRHREPSHRPRDRQKKAAALRAQIRSTAAA